MLEFGWHPAKISTSSSQTSNVDFYSLFSKICWNTVHCIKQRSSISNGYDFHGRCSTCSTVWSIQHFWKHATHEVSSVLGSIKGRSFSCKCWTQHALMPVGLPIQQRGNCSTCQSILSGAGYDITSLALVVGRVCKTRVTKRYKHCMFKWNGIHFDEGCGCCLHVAQHSVDFNEIWNLQVIVLLLKQRHISWEISSRCASKPLEWTDSWTKFSNKLRMLTQRLLWIHGHLCLHDVWNIVYLVQGKSSIWLTSDSTAHKDEVIRLPPAAPRKWLLDLFKNPHVAIKTTANDVVDMQSKKSYNAVVVLIKEAAGIKAMLSPLPLLGDDINHVHVPSPWCVCLTIHRGTQHVYHEFVLPFWHHFQTYIVLGRSHVYRFRSFCVWKTL